MPSRKEAHSGLEQARAKLAMLRHSCEGLDRSWPDVKLSGAWFEGAAEVLGEAVDKVDDVLEWLADLPGETE